MIDRKSLEIRKRKGLRQVDRWNISDEFRTPRFIGRAGVTPVPCSCFICGNRRTKLKGEEHLTIQERKAFEADRYILSYEEDRFADRFAA